MKKIMTMLAMTAAILAVSCNKNDKPGKDNKEEEEEEYVAPIIIDGDTSDWAKLDASRSLLYQTSMYVDIYKALEDIQRERKLEAESHEKAIEDIKSERTGLREELELNRQEQQKEYLRQNTVRMSIVREQEKKKEAAGSAEELHREQKQIEQAGQELEAARKEAEERLRSSSENEKKMDEAVKELEGKLAELRQQEGGFNQVLSKWETEIEKIGQQQSYEQRDLDRVRDELARRNAELKEITDAIEKGDIVMKAGEEKIRELREQLTGSEDVQDDSRRLLKEMSEKREKLGEEIRGRISQKETLSEKRS